jgi:hypothetical protein
MALTLPESLEPFWPTELVTSTDIWLAPCRR